VSRSGADLDPAIPEHATDGGIHGLTVEALRIEIQSGPLLEGLGFVAVGVVLELIEKGLVAA